MPEKLQMSTLFEPFLVWILANFSLPASQTKRKSTFYSNKYFAIHYRTATIITTDTMIAATYLNDVIPVWECEEAEISFHQWDDVIRCRYLHPWEEGKLIHNLFTFIWYQKNIEFLKYWTIWW